MSKLYKLTSSLNRYALCVINLSLVNFFKIAYFHFFGDGRIIRLNTKNFNEIYYRSNGDIGVLAHFFTAQTGFVFKSPYEMKTIFDLGANIGIETIRMKKMFPNSKIISVELEKENFKLLQKNTKALKNVETIKKPFGIASDRLALLKKIVGITRLLVQRITIQKGRLRLSQ